MKLHFGEETEGGNSAAKRAASSMRATLVCLQSMNMQIEIATSMRATLVYLQIMNMHNKIELWRHNA